MDHSFQKSNNNHPVPERKAAKHVLLFLLSLFSGIFYLIITIGIVYLFHDKPFTSLFEHDYNLFTQLIFGGLAGIVAGFLYGWILFHSSMSKILSDYSLIKALRKLPMTRFDRIHISFFAGAGEELLFRGALQPLIGIFLTSLLFIALHGYFKFSSLKHLLFGGMMFFLAMGLGLLFIYVGLIAAITAHAFYDFVILELYFSDKNKNPDNSS